MITAKGSTPYDLTEGPGLFYDVACDHCKGVIGANDDGYSLSAFALPKRSSSSGDWQAGKAAPVSHVHSRCLEAWLEQQTGEFNCVPVYWSLAETLIRLGGLMSDAQLGRWDCKPYRSRGGIGMKASESADWPVYKPGAVARFIGIVSGVKQPKASTE